MNNCTLDGFREHYPAIFSRCRSFSCGDGWFGLLDTLCKQLTDAVESGAPPVVAVQAKEKFGTLRFYVSGGDEATNALIDAAVAESAHICEQCGATPATMSALGGIYRTRCAGCYTALRKELGNHVFDFCSEGDIGPALLSHRHRVVEAFVEIFGLDRVMAKWQAIKADQSEEKVRQVKGILGTIQTIISETSRREAIARAYPILLFCCGATAEQIELLEREFVSGRMSAAEAADKLLAGKPLHPEAVRYLRKRAWKRGADEESSIPKQFDVNEIELAEGVIDQQEFVRRCVVLALEGVL